MDLGNTRGKWRIVSGTDIVARGVSDIDTWLAGAIPREWFGVQCVRIASVRDPVLEQALLAVLNGLNAPVRFARPQAICAGVTNAYAQIERLGVDRWLAMLAAYNEFQSAVLILQAGSALTLDLIDNEGLHRGGYIIPGARLMAQVLLNSTDRVRFESTGMLASTAPGCVTDDCVQNGIALALAGAARLCLVQSRATLGSVRLVTAGGDAEALHKLLAEEDISWRPDLVLDGLHWALP